MNDLFLTLAQAPGGLTCFVLPRVLPDGTRNAHPADAAQGQARQPVQRVGRDRVRRARSAGGSATEGRGVATIIEMVSMTRLDCVLGSASLMRAALSEAAHHVAHRSAFGAPLARTAADADGDRGPRAGVRGGHRAGAAAGRARSTATSAAFLRLALPAAKYLVCKRAPAVVAEALECLGGNGFVEDSGLPRRYREAPLNSIWEGSGNVTALDVLRAITREPDAVAAVARRAGRRGGRRRVVRPRGAGAARRAAQPRAAPGPADGRAARAVPAGQPAAAARAGRGRGRVRGLPLPPRRAVAHGGHAARSTP